MKRSIKYLVLGFFVSILSLSIMSCSRESNKALSKGKDLIEDNQCDKAIVSLELALDEDPKNEEAEELKNMVENYLESRKALEEGQIRKAEVKFQNIGDRSKDFPKFKECVDTLEKNIDEDSKYDKEIKDDMDKLESLIEDKNYEESIILIKSLDGRVRTREQKEKLEQLKLKLISILAIESEKNK